MFLNDGAGRLASIGEFGNGYTSRSIEAGNLDSTTTSIWAFANPGISQITVLLNAGDGTHPTWTFNAAGDNCNDVVMADTDRDGDLDLATANHYSHNVVAAGQPRRRHLRDAGRLPRRHLSDRSHCRRLRRRSVAGPRRRGP